VRGFHLSGRVLVLLPGGSSNRFTVEGELVPVDSPAPVGGHFLIILSILFLLVFGVQRRELTVWGLLSCLTGDMIHEALREIGEQRCGFALLDSRARVC